MPVEKQGADRDDSSRVEDRATGEGVPVEHGPVTSLGHRLTRMRMLLIGVIGALILAAVLAFGIPYIQMTLNTISTDDAYVNGHVTFVAPRVAGQIARVLVDDNNRVHKGDLIAELDKEPFAVAVAEKKAAVDVAAADLQAATATARGIEAQARAARWKLQNAVQEVDNQVALLHARVAALDKSKAELALAQVEFGRAKQLVTTAVVSRELYDQRQAALSTAAANVTQSLAEIRQVRVSLGLPPQPDKGGDLDRVPPDLDETFSSVLQAQSDLIESAAQLGVVHSYDQSPKQMIQQFEGQGDIDRTFAELMAQAPPIKQAEAKLESAKRDLAQAELNLPWVSTRMATGSPMNSRQQILLRPRSIRPLCPFPAEFFHVIPASGQPKEMVRSYSGESVVPVVTSQRCLSQTGAGFTASRIPTTLQAICRPALLDTR